MEKKEKAFPKRTLGTRKGIGTNQKRGKDSRLLGNDKVSGNDNNQVNVKKRGRPCGYDPEICGKILEYFDKEPYKEVEEEIITKRGKLKVKKLKPCDLPLVQDVCKKYKISKSTLYDWSNAKTEEGVLKYPELSDSLKRAKDSQERILVINGLLGFYKSPAWIFAAKNILGWRDAVDVTSKDESLSEMQRSIFVVPGFKDVEKAVKS